MFFGVISFILDRKQMMMGSLKISLAGVVNMIMQLMKDDIVGVF